VFGDEVFPAIDESRFAVLYSAGPASRPNTPANVVVGTLIIKEMFDHSGDGLVEALMFVVRPQHALHTTSFAEQPLSDKTLARCLYGREPVTGEDLFRGYVRGLAASIAASLGAIPGYRRQIGHKMCAGDGRRSFFLRRGGGKAILLVRVWQDTELSSS
jgi:hypothetical protein